jgi:phage-related baseplate assembly protein
MEVLEKLDAESIITARMRQLVSYWFMGDPPSAAQYDVGNLEFDPLRINQECSTYFELLLRDRINQAARSVTLAFATGGDLDAIASRYPGGMPRIANESDENYRTRIWLSSNLFSKQGIYESYVYYALTAALLAGTPIRDCQASAIPGKPDVRITIMADGTPISYDPIGKQFTPAPSPLPTDAQCSEVFSYIAADGMGRKGLTDVISVGGPSVITVPYVIRIQLYPGWEQASIMLQLAIALGKLLESQRYLGFSHTRAAIDGALKVSGVFDIFIDSPSVDVIIPATSVVVVPSVSLTYAGRAGIGPLPPNT